MVSPFKVDLVFLVERVKVKLGIVCAFISAQGDTLAGGHKWYYRKRNYF